MKIWLVLVMTFLCLLQIAIDCSAAWQSVNRSLKPLRMSAILATSQILVPEGNGSPFEFLYQQEQKIFADSAVEAERHFTSYIEDFRHISRTF